MSKKSFDKVFLGIVSVILIVGIFSFVSASLGVLAKSEAKFYGILFNQVLLGLTGGSIALFLVYKIDYRFWRKHAFYLFLGSILLTLLVFVPKLGFSHGGATRWVALGPVTFQPVEFLKIGFVIYFAAWLSWTKGKVEDFKFGILPLIILLAIIAGLLFKQPDTKSFILIMIAGLAMLLVSGVPWKYIFGMAAIGVVALGGLVLTKPYLLDRVHTFLDPSRDPSGSSYQLQQSLIAIGSGQTFGRGFGQSIQKFSYLPEPQGDSIFAVIGEEFGFFGSTLLILLYIAFMLRGMRIANTATDSFGRLVVTGLITLFIAQSFLHIASNIGLFPLTGVPLVFVSQGGTSLLVALASLGIILNVSKREKAPVGQSKK
jgi:cell division protein FtsW